jgi:N-acylneuraminate cytidylyltransferase
MKIICVIPARGGSKSIPRKNIRLLNGRPLIDYSINYSLNCPLVDKTIVSTEDDEIAKIALNCGAEVPFMRPKELAEDDTEDYPFMKHALDFFDSKDVHFDAYVLLRPTSPLRAPGLIEAGIALLKKYPQASAIRAVTEAKEHPYRVWKEDGPYIRGYMQSEDNPEPFNISRQMLPKAYFQTGDIEIVRDITLREGSVNGKNILPLIIKGNFVDIDNESDIELAENILKK